MNCPWCDATNREGAAFCRNCGRLLLAACPTCGASLRQSEVKWTEAHTVECGFCGTPIRPSV